MKGCDVMCWVVCGSVWIGPTRDGSWLMWLVCALVAACASGARFVRRSRIQWWGWFARCEYVGSVQRARARGCRHTVRAAVQDTPSYAPSASPTEVLSAAPTETPTETPSAMPTQAPSTEPSVAPTAEPSAAPTSSPSDAPSTTPTEAPSAGPSEAPSSEPTAEPSITPTEEPTTLSPTTTVRAAWSACAVARHDERV